MLATKNLQNHEKLKFEGNLFYKACIKRAAHITHTH
jgi:hypothetical protein